MAQGDLTKLESRLHTAVTSPRNRSRPGRYGRTEWPCFKPWLESMRGRKSLQTANTLISIWDIPLNEANIRADVLVKAGIFKRHDRSEVILYEIPYLYRPALQIIRGAEIGLRADITLADSDPELDFGADDAHS